MDQALAQVIDFQLEERTGVELSSAYRALCCAMLIHTAQILTAKQTTRKDYVKMRAAAKGWKDGGKGVLTFEQACDAIDLCPRLVVERLDAYVSSKASGPIITSGKYGGNKRPRRHYVFGKSCHHALVNKPETAD